MPLTIKGRRVSKDYLIEHGIIKDYFESSEEEKSKDCTYKDTIKRQDAIDVLTEYGNGRVVYISIEEAVRRIEQLPSVQSTLYGYNIEHLELIARVLQKENLPPERVVEALTDINRIVDIVKDEFEETLRKAVEQCMI